MEISDTVFLTLTVALVGAIIEIGVILVLYKSLRAVQAQNKHHEIYFENQRIVNRNSLTFRFADWLSTEVKYYSPLYEGNKDRKYILTQAEINDHLVAMSNKAISLCKKDIVDIDILKDEVERLIATLHVLKPEPTETIVELRKLL